MPREKIETAFDGVLGALKFGAQSPTRAATLTATASKGASRLTSANVNRHRAADLMTAKTADARMRHFAISLRSAIARTDVRRERRAQTAGTERRRHFHRQTAGTPSKYAGRGARAEFA